MAFRLIALDLDGTLLDPQHRISPANAAAVAACQARGAHVLIATGRMYASAQRYVRALGLHGPQIMFNGAVLADPDDGRLFVRDHLAPGLLAAAIEQLEARQLHYVAFDAHTIYALPDTPHLDLLESYGSPPAQILSRAELLQVRDPIKALTFLPPGPHDAELAELLGDRFEVIRTNPLFFEFMPPGVNKGSALADLMLRYEVAREEVLAIGDGENDIGMFGVAGMSVAMGGAPAAVRAAARDSTAHCADDGVALALERYVLRG